METTIRRRGAAALSLAAITALTLTACDSADEALDAGEDNEPESNVTVGAEDSGSEESGGEDSGGDESAEASPEAGQETDQAAEPDTTDDADDEASEGSESSEDASTDEDVENHPVYGGLAAVEAEYPEGVVFEVEDNDSSYEWDVYVDGAVQQVDVDKQSLEIVQTSQDEAPDAEDQSEIDAIEVTLEEALRTVEDRAGDPSGAFVDEVQLDTEGGTIVWQIELADGTEIDLDVASGEVVGEETD